MRRRVKEKLLRFDGRPLFPERRAYMVPDNALKLLGSWAATADLAEPASATDQGSGVDSR
jgi:hypothetical protein